MKPRTTYTEDDFTAMQNKVRGGVDGDTQREGQVKLVVKSHAHLAAGSNPAPSPYKSKLEEAFAYRLVLEKRTGAIDEFWYEPLNLRLPGGKNFYKPDFLVSAHDCLTFYEVKGRNKSDDRSLVKIKTAAGLTPWAKFVLVKRIHGNWEERTIA